MHTNNGAFGYLHHDHLGSTRATSGIPSGNTYRAYGREDGGTQTEFRFTGQETNALGLVYMHARYYDPRTGQFLSPDTIVPDATNLLDYNRYLYARANPLEYNDPSGHSAKRAYDPGEGARLAGGVLRGGGGALAALVAAITSYYTLDPQQGSILATPETHLPNWIEAFPSGGYEGVTIGGIPLPEYEPDAIISDPALSEIGIGVFQDPMPSGVDSAPYIYSAGTFRKNLEKLNPSPIEGGPYDAHHVFPRKFAAQFQGKIDIHNPIYGLWVESSIHRSDALQYNADWEAFLASNPNALEMIQFGLQLSKEYGYDK